MYSLLAIDFSKKEFFPPAQVVSIGYLLNFIFPLILAAAAVVCLGMLLFAAFTWMTAGDKADNVSKAHKIITFAILGLILIIFSFAAMKLIGMMLGIGDPLNFS
ncbi:MAG: hypothetical protein ABIO02_02450 [Patescibacteria group bacterium]